MLVELDVELHLFCPIGLELLCVWAFHILVSLNRLILVNLWLVYRIEGVDGCGGGGIRVILLGHFLVFPFLGIFRSAREAEVHDIVSLWRSNGDVQSFWYMDS